MSINGTRFSTLQGQSFSVLIDSHQHHTRFFRDKNSVNTKQLYPRDFTSYFNAEFSALDHSHGLTVRTGPSFGPKTLYHMEGSDIVASPTRSPKWAVSKMYGSSLSGGLQRIPRAWMVNL